MCGAAYMQAASIVFPFRQTFRRLELQRRWWHRLCIVLFFVALTLAPFTVWALMMSSTQPANILSQNVHYWYEDKSGNRVELSDPPQEAVEIAPEMQDASDGKQAVRLDQSKSAPIHAAVNMPDGNTKEFVRKSPKEITTEWNKALRKARLNQEMLSLGVAIGVIVIFNYLLQGAYRALLYVIFGNTVQAV